MRPYTFYHGDCLDILPTLEAGSVDAVICDPPYCAGAISEAQRTRAIGQGLRSENLRRFGWFTGDNMGTAGLMWLLRSVAVEATYLVKETGSALFFADWRMVPVLVPAIESAGLRYQGLIVWDKGSMGLGAGFRCQHEMILHFTFGSPQYHDKGTSNVIRARRVSSADRVHQTEKPIDLLEQLIGVVAPLDGMVIDPFMGSGTTGHACANTGRCFIGIEKDQSYYDIAAERVTSAYEPLRTMQVAI